MAQRFPLLTGALSEHIAPVPNAWSRSARARPLTSETSWPCRSMVVVTNLWPSQRDTSEMGMPCLASRERSVRCAQLLGPSSQELENLANIRQTSGMAGGNPDYWVAVAAMEPVLALSLLVLVRPALKVRQWGWRSGNAARAAHNNSVYALLWLGILYCACTAMGAIVALQLHLQASWVADVFIALSLLLVLLASFSMAATEHGIASRENPPGSAATPPSTDDSPV